jgi:Flp pilus assembly protein TadB
LATHGASPIILFVLIPLLTAYVVTAAAMLAAWILARMRRARRMPKKTAGMTGR